MSAAPPSPQVIPDDTVNGQRGKARRILLSIATLALLVGLGWAAWWWLSGRFIETTDDAYLQADSISVAPKISGYVAQVLVSDNQNIKRGDVLVRLDARKYQAVSDEATATIAARQADFAKAQADLVQQDSTIAEARAQLQGAQADARHAQAEVARYAPLARSGAEPQERLAQLNNQLAQARSTVAAKQAALRSSETRYGTLQAQLKQAQAQLGVAKASEAQSQLDVDDAVIRSPLDGRVADRGVRVGQYVQPGTRLLTVVPISAIYLTANYKETQIGDMRPGQSVSVHVDALPGRKLEGHIDSLSPGTGAQFALLPPSNATGNFTKIVQRVPVRIALDIPEEVRIALMPGLSATVEVDTRTHGADANHG
ncbi:multidrug ABC transporter permease [Pseudomonas palleroniana]|uniref:Multidrug ABC transporter permease n=1 Tax=Pseudomonas palleroniana TaxID=191390 RepID=A0A2L1J6B6_9PSED|nr:HlyD family secretion protein [Pseudomonas palleroniana]AVE04032.1 multidrug ABC transporter permease [Pseudomonas palleroniana]